MKLTILKKLLNIARRREWASKAKLVWPHVKIMTKLLKNAAIWPFSKIKSAIYTTKRWFSVKKHNTFVRISRFFKTIFGFISTYKKEILLFLHVSAMFFFFTWGLEVILPFTIWRITVALFLMFWLGFVYMWNIFKIGVYLAD